MSDPITWAILKQIKARIETVRVANGYYTDIGKNVSLEAFRPHDLKDGELVRVVSPSDDLSDGEPAKTRTGTRFVTGSMTVVIEYVIPATRADAHEKAHRGRADLLRVLRDTPQTWTRGCRGFAVQRRDILDQPYGLPVVVVQLTARADIHEATPPPAA